MVTVTSTIAGSANCSASKISRPFGLLWRLLMANPRTGDRQPDLHLRRGFATVQLFAFRRTRKHHARPHDRSSRADMAPVTLTSEEPALVANASHVPKLQDLNRKITDTGANATKNVPPFCTSASHGHSVR